MVHEHVYNLFNVFFISISTQTLNIKSGLVPTSRCELVRDENRGS